MSETQSTQQLILKALVSKFQAERNEAVAELSILINASVGVGDHATHIDDAAKCVKRIAEAEDGLKVLTTNLQPAERSEPS